MSEVIKTIISRVFTINKRSKSCCVRLPEDIDKICKNTKVTVSKIECSEDGVLKYEVRIGPTGKYGYKNSFKYLGFESPDISYIMDEDIDDLDNLISLIHDQNIGFYARMNLWKFMMNRWSEDELLGRDTHKPITQFEKQAREQIRASKLLPKSPDEPDV